MYNLINIFHHHSINDMKNDVNLENRLAITAKRIFLNKTLLYILTNSLMNTLDGAHQEGAEIWATPTELLPSPQIRAIEWLDKEEKYMVKFLVKLYLKMIPYLNM